MHGNRDGFLFLFKEQLLTLPQLVLKLQKALALAGVESKKCGAQFQIGAATMRAACGVPVSVIKTLGRWKSQVYQLYVRIPDMQLALITKSLARMWVRPGGDVEDRSQSGHG